MSEAKQIRVTLRRSLIGRKQNQRATAKLLGLTRIGRSVVVADRPEIRGMVETIRFLVEVEEGIE
jgi:large subunit ribosomal protein L30